MALIYNYNFIKMIFALSLLVKKKWTNIISKVLGGQPYTHGNNNSLLLCVGLIKCFPIIVQETKRFESVLNFFKYSKKYFSAWYQYTQFKFKKYLIHK